MRVIELITCCLRSYEQSSDNPIFSLFASTCPWLACFSSELQSIYLPMLVGETKERIQLTFISKLHCVISSLFSSISSNSTIDPPATWV